MSPAQAALLDRYEAVLKERAIPLGMIALSDRSRLRERHLLDALRGVPLIPEGLVVDLGSGAGLPGISLAIALPDAEVVLTERRPRRAAFLEHVVESLALPNARVFVGAAERCGERAGSCVARAFAAPPATWRVAQSILVPDGVLLLWAGRGARIQVEGTWIRSFPAPTLAKAGPIVMMGRQ